MMTRRVPTLLVAAIQLGVVASVAAQAQPDRIAMARRVSVRSLDSTMANVPFERWLTDLARVAPSAIRWEVNDCGEGGDGRAAPTCVEASITLGGDSTAIISLVVADLEGKPGQAEVWSVVIGSGTKFTDLRTLAAWAAEVRARRR